MAKIFYTVMAEGMGHATRSREMVDFLKRNHDVTVFTGGRAYEYIKDFAPKIHKIETFNILYKNNCACTWGTITLNYKKMDQIMNSYDFLRQKIREEKPDLLITDFEPLGNYAAKKEKIPCINIDNQHFIRHGHYKLGLNIFPFLASYAIIRAFIRKTDYKIVLTFNKEINQEGVCFCKPVLRKKLSEFESKDGDFFLVYQTTESNVKLLSILRELPHKFVVYGYGKEETSRNITFRGFDEHQFLADLSSCKAAILGGGFSAITEALYYKKPILSTPVKGQYEQILNGKMLEELGFGMYSKKITKDQLQRFIWNCNRYKKNLDNFVLELPDAESTMDRCIKEILKNNSRS